MSNKLVGIRFIANKDLMEDTVTNSGATWTRGQVNNFSENLAKLLLVHSDVFELADVDPDADTFVGKRTVGGGIEPVAFVNLNAMDEAQLSTFSRMEFNRNLNLEGKTVEQLRTEVHGYMTNKNLDLEAEHKSKLLAGGMILEKEVTAEEYKAVLDGVLELKLVPVSAIAEIINTTENGDGNNDLKTGADTPTSTDEQNPAVDDDNQGVDPSDDEKTLSLPELVASLDKNELRAFAKQEGVTYANSMNEEQLRAKLLRDLADKTPAPSVSAEAGL